MAGSEGDALAVGTMVGGYRVEYRIGAGGMGTVYAAEEPRIRKRVAVKVLRQGLDDPASVARFEREARAANGVQHPAIVDVFAFGKLDDGRPYLVMSLLQGRSLRDEIRERGKIPPAEAWSWAREIAEALAAAHEAGIVHRDLKPDNVFIERFASGAARPRLLDLGLAKLVLPPEPDAADEGDRMKLTATGTPMGTPRYMAPEQWWGHEVDARADQYALGVTVFEMLTGRPPFLSEQFIELGQQHLHALPPAPSASGADVPPAVDALVARAMEKKAADRFASMTELVTAGDAAFRGLEAPLDATQAAPSGAGAPAPAGTAAASASAASTAASAAPAVAAQSPAVAKGARLGRFFAVHALAVVGGPAALVAIGYAGSSRRDVREWVIMAGWFIWGVGASYVAGVVAVAAAAARRARTGESSTLPWVLAITTGAAGAIGTYLGWQKTSGGVAKLRAPVRFEILHQGIYELEVNRFVGFFLASVLFVSIAAAAGLAPSPPPSDTLVEALGVRRRESLGAALTLVALAVVAGLLGAPSGSLVAGAAACVVALDAVLPPLDRRTAAAAEIERAVAGGAALAILLSAALSRVDARQAALWHEEPTRAARAAEIVLAARERERTLAIGALSFAVLAGIEIVRLRRVLRSGAPGRRIAEPLTLLGVVAVLGASDVVLHGGFSTTRDQIHTELAPQFSLFARLDPPASDVLDPKRHAPHPAPGLQIARNVVAVNAKASAPLLAIESDEGMNNVSRDLSHALADHVAHASDDEEAFEKDADRTPIDLAVSVDKHIPWRVVDRLLGLAYRAGVRRTEVLLTRGPATDLPSGAPPEASWVMGRDFVAVRVDLVGPEGRDAPGVFRAPGDEPFGDVAPRLVRGADGGAPVRIAPP